MKKNIKKIVLYGVVMFALSGMIFAGIIMNIANSNYEKTLITLDYKELKEKIDNKDDFILVFTSETCSSCQTFKPKLQRLLLENEIIAYEVVSQDFDSEAEMAYLNSIATVSGTPTTVYIEDGEEKSTSYRLVGDKTSTDIKASLTRAGYIK